MLTGAVCPVSRASPSVFHGCFIVNEFSTRSTKEYEKSTDSVRGQLFQATSQPNQERQSIFLDVIVNDFSTYTYFKLNQALRESTLYRKRHCELMDYSQFHNFTV